MPKCKVILFLRLLFSIIDFYHHTEEKLNDQFSQLGLNNGPSLPPVQHNTFVSKYFEKTLLIRSLMCKCNYYHYYYF